MKRLYTLVFLAITCVAIASTQGIQGKITNFGIFRSASKEEVIKSPQTPSGVTRVDVGGPILVCATNIIPAKIGILFGMSYEISNVPGPDRVIDVTKIARHPRITKPDGTTTDGFTSIEKQPVLGGKVEGFTGYGFDHDYELVAGDWEFEIQYGGQTIGTQKFTVLKE
jgi:hypothetical protein